MFPIRKRKQTYGTFSEPKRTKYDNINIMPYMRRTYKRRSTFKRRTPYNKRSNNGGFFNPKGSQPPIKRKRWDWLKVRVAVPQAATNLNIFISDVFAEAANQLNYQPSSIKVSSVQFWNSAGVTAGTQKPFIIAKPYAQHATATAPDTTIGKVEDEGNLQTPAKIGYKWSATDAQTVYPFGSTRKLVEVDADNGDNCYAHFMIQHFKE